MLVRPLLYGLLALGVYIYIFGTLSLVPVFIRAACTFAVCGVVYRAFAQDPKFRRGVRQLLKELARCLRRVRRDLEEPMKDIEDEVRGRNSEPFRNPSETYMTVLGSWISTPAYQLLTQGAYFTRHTERSTEKIFFVVFPELGTGMDHPHYFDETLNVQITERIVLKMGVQRDRVVEKRFGEPTGFAGFFTRSKIKTTTYRIDELMGIATGASSKGFARVRTEQGFLSTILLRKSPRMLDARACFSLLFPNGSVDLEANDVQQANAWLSALAELISAVDASLKTAVLPKNLTSVAQTHPRASATQSPRARGNSFDRLENLTFDIMPPLETRIDRRQGKLGAKGYALSQNNSRGSIERTNIWLNYSHVIKLRTIRPLNGWRFTIIVPYSLYATLLKPGLDGRYAKQRLTAGSSPLFEAAMMPGGSRFGKDIRFTAGDVLSADFFKLAPPRTIAQPVQVLNATQRIADALSTVRAHLGDLNPKTMAMITHLDRAAIRAAFTNPHSRGISADEYLDQHKLLSVATELLRVVPLVEPFQAGSIMRRVAAVAIASHGSRTLFPSIWALKLRKDAESLAGNRNDPTNVLSYSSVADDGATVRYLLFDPNETADRDPHQHDVLRAFRYAAKSLPGYSTSVLPLNTSSLRLVKAAVKEVLTHRLPKLARAIAYYKAVGGIDINSDLVQQADELHQAISQRAPHLASSLNWMPSYANSLPDHHEPTRKAKHRSTKFRFKGSLPVSLVLPFTPSKLRHVMSNLIASAYDVVFGTFDPEADALTRARILAKGLEDDDNGIRLLGLEGTSIRCLSFLRLANSMLELLEALGKPFTPICELILPHIQVLEKAFSSSSPDLLFTLVEDDINRLQSQRPFFAGLADSISSSKLGSLITSIRKKRSDSASDAGSDPNTATVRSVSLSDSPAITTEVSRSSSTRASSSNFVANRASIQAAEQSTILTAVRWISRCARFLSLISASQFDAIDAQTACITAFTLSLERACENLYFKQRAKVALNTLRNDLTLAETLCLEHSDYKPAPRFPIINMLFSSSSSSAGSATNLTVSSVQVYDSSHPTSKSLQSTPQPSPPLTPSLSPTAASTPHLDLSRATSSVPHEDVFTPILSMLGQQQGKGGTRFQWDRSQSTTQMLPLDKLFDVLELARLGPRSVTWMLLKAQPALQILATLVDRECMERWRLSNS